MFLIKLSMFFVIVLVVFLFKNDFLPKKFFTIIITTTSVMTGLVSITMVGFGIYNTITGWLTLGFLTLCVSCLFIGLTLLIVKYIVIIQEKENKNLSNNLSLVSNLFIVVFSWGTLIISIIPENHFYDTMNQIHQYGLVAFFFVLGSIFSFNAFNDYKKR